MDFMTTIHELDNVRLSLMKTLVGVMSGIVDARVPSAVALRSKLEEASCRESTSWAIQQPHICRRTILDWQKTVGMASKAEEDAIETIQDFMDKAGGSESYASMPEATAKPSEVDNILNTLITSILVTLTSLTTLEGQASVDSLLIGLSKVHRQALFQLRKHNTASLRLDRLIQPRFDDVAIVYGSSKTADGWEPSSEGAIPKNSDKSVIQTWARAKELQRQVWQQDPSTLNDVLHSIKEMTDTISWLGNQIQTSVEFLDV